MVVEIETKAKIIFRSCFQPRHNREFFTPTKAKLQSHTPPQTSDSVVSVFSL